MAQEKLYLLDGMALVYRAYYALFQANLKSLNNEPTGAVYGFTATLIKLMEDHKPDHIAVVFDTAAPTFRHQQYDQYKAQRAPMPEDMKPQISAIKEVVRAFDIPVLEIDGYEADDIIGTLAKKAGSEGVDVVMVTPDKDYMQLVDDRIRILRPTSKNESGFEWISFREVQDKFGVMPEKVIDVLGLMGDSSDNVPGVPGIGEKTAIKLIQEFGSVEKALEAAKANPTAKNLSKLAANEDLARASRYLVTIDVNTPVELDWKTLKVTQPQFEKLISLFHQLNFKTFKSRIENQHRSHLSGPGGEDLFGSLPQTEQGFSRKTIRTTDHHYQIVRSREEAGSYLNQRSQETPVCFDLETTHLDAMVAEPVGIALSVKEFTGIYIPVNPDDPADIRAKLSWIQPVLTNPDVKKIGQNVKYDSLILKRYGIDVYPVFFDTMIAAFVADSAQAVNMDDLAEKYLDYKPVPISDLIGTGKNQKNMKDVPVEQAADYAAEDADVTFRLWQALEPELDKTAGTAYCREIDFPLIPVLTDMEYEGVRIDTDFLKELSSEMTRKLLEYREEIYSHAGFEFNINSPKQLGEVLFGRLGLPPSKKTQTGYSTDVSVLEGLRFVHPIIESILNYRQTDKLKGTYVDALPEMVNPRTGRVHSTFAQAIAATGRLSSNNPNLQNIPIRTDSGREIRKAFIPSSPGHVLISADYSQIELRIVASLAGDSAMKTMFEQGADIHNGTAARVFGVPAEEVTRDMRRKAKEVNFGIIYGISPFGLASRLGIPQAEARDIINRYFSTFPAIKTYMETVVSEGRKKGFVETLKGRRRYIPDLNSSNRNIQQNAERVAINTPVQGTAADMIKLAMISVHNWLKTSGLSCKMILQVHDELIFDCPVSEKDQVIPVIKNLMETALPLDVPIVTEAGTGMNWLDAH